MPTLTYSQKQSALSKIMSRISSAGKYGAQFLMYATSLGAIAVIGGAQLPLGLQPLIGNLGINMLSSLIDRVAKGENVSDTELQHQIEKAISESKLKKLLTKDEFSRALEILVRNQNEMISDYQSSRLELNDLRMKLSDLAAALQNREFIAVKIDPSIFEHSLDIKFSDKKAGDKFLSESLPELVAEIPKRNFSIMLADIDNLTQINNLYGQEVGDNILTAVGNTIFKVVKSQHVGRCGDDTFFVLLLDIDIEKARKIAEALRFQIKHLPWSALSTNLRVTCCFGLAQRRGDEPTEDVVTRAALGLVKAKESGENVIKAGPKFLDRNQSRTPHSYYS
jgi:diguanylate cyclase (GGDEF)-like protein